MRGDWDLSKTVLRPFPHDEFDETRRKVPIYLTQINTEGILLEIERRKVIDFLEEQGVIKEPPEFGREKEWFIKNIDPRQVTRFSGVLEDGVTKHVFSLLHTISHALMKQIPDQCGIGIDQIGEIIFTSVPAILIFSQEKGEFRLEALKDLFENKIVPWIDISFKKSRPKFCIYDPVCFDSEGACHSCLYLQETSCGYYNQDLSRHMLFGNSRNKIGGFWDSCLKKF